MKHNLNLYNNFQEFYTKNNLTRAEAIEFLEKEVANIGDEAIELAKEYKNKAKKYKSLLQKFMRTRLEHEFFR